MEWWDNLNMDGTGQAVVGFSGDDVYLTFDIRSNGVSPYPVFSSICKVGAENGHRKEAYEHYRELFNTLDGYKIRELNICIYRMKENPNVKIKFRKNH